MNPSIDVSALLQLLAVLPDDPDHFRARVRTTTGWPELLELAGRHGVDQVLREALRTFAPEIAPLSLQCLDERQTFEAIAARVHDRAITEVAHALDAAAVRAIFLKGPTLGDRLYPARVHRPSTDLDVLVSPSEVTRSVDALRARGWQPEDDADRALARPWMHHIELDRPGAPPVELHFRLHSEFGADLPAADFVARARRHVRRDGTAVWILAPEDELLHLAVHASAHRCIRIGWLYDLKLFVLAHPDLDWPLLAARARAHGLFAAVSFALGLTAHDLGAPIPREITALDAPRAALARVLTSSWATHEGPIPVQRASSFAFAAMLADHPLQTVRSVRHLLTRFGARQAEALSRRLGW